MATLFLLYGLVSYLIFLVSLNYFILFTKGLWVPTTVNHANEASIALACLIDIGLVALFAIQHTVTVRYRVPVILQPTRWPRTWASRSGGSPHRRWRSTRERIWNSGDHTSAGG